jgi:hypothetical protein
MGCGAADAIGRRAPMIANSAWQSAEVAGKLHQQSLDRWREQLDRHTLARIEAVPALLPVRTVTICQLRRQLRPSPTRCARGRARAAARVTAGTAGQRWAADRAPWTSRPPSTARSHLGRAAFGHHAALPLMSEHPSVAYPTERQANRGRYRLLVGCFRELRGPALASLATLRRCPVRAAYADLVRAQDKTRLLEKRRSWCCGFRW